IKNYVKKRHLKLIGRLIVCTEPYSLLYTLLTLLIVACFFGFGYFLFCPITNKDFYSLDDTQRWQYETLCRCSSPEPKSYNACWVLWLNPVATAITLVLLFTLIF
ncbi:MAG: hypothetical protein ACFNLQ_07315, partial [Capnocytophaga ochracea]